MSDIEEDINELKHIMTMRTDCGFAYSQKNTVSLQKSIENVLNDYIRQKQINEELIKKVKRLEEQVEYDKTHIYTPLTIQLNYIPKQKIKNKKEEFNDKAKRIAGTYQYADSEDDLIEKKNKVIKLRTKAEACEELLQESEDK